MDLDSESIAAFAADITHELCGARLPGPQRMRALTEARLADPDYGFEPLPPESGSLLAPPSLYAERRADGSAALH